MHGKKVKDKKIVDSWVVIDIQFALRKKKKKKNKKKNTKKKKKKKR